MASLHVIGQPSGGHMFKGRDGILRVNEVPAGVDRRTALELGATGGATLALAMFGGLLGSAADAAAQQMTTKYGGPQIWGGGRFRRLVTGHNAKNRSCLISDEIVDLSKPGTGTSPVIWKTVGSEPLGPTPAGEPRPFRTPSGLANSIDPAVGGTNAMFGVLQPSKGPKPDTTNRIGFHRTSTLDYTLILTNSLVLILEEDEVSLNPGDLVIQRNTDHAWWNNTNMPT